ncbi:MAG: helix-turn-helix transcriptional regulator [Gammaproteobacteria bacterium]|nr:helix-turn-helix transcriptional regulator [Gammaproteobacteria bacterium]
MDRRRSSHIVPEIYEATIDPNHWDYVITMIAKLTKSKSACLYYKNKELDIASTIAQFGLPQGERMNFNDHCDTLDDMFCSKQESNAEEPICTQFYPGSNGVMQNDSSLYVDWMKPNDIYHVGGAQFVDTISHKAGIAILRDEKAGIWEEGEMRVINEILPHLRRALNIHSEFTHLRLKQDALLKGLDRLVIGLILYDNNAQPVYINPTAQAIIDGHPAMQLQNGDLILTNPEDEKNLRKTIIDTAAIDPDDSWKQSVAIGITHPDVEAPLPILVTPMHAHLITTDLDYDGAKVAVFLSDPNLQQPISIDNLVSVYSLTPSEAQVAISLANGHSIDDIAESSHHSAHTIRSQLKSVFRKTGVSRQSELIKLLLTGPFAQRRRSAKE